MAIFLEISLKPCMEFTIMYIMVNITSMGIYNKTYRLMGDRWTNRAVDTTVSERDEVLRENDIMQKQANL